MFIISEVHRIKKDNINKSHVQIKHNEDSIKQIDMALKMLNQMNRESFSQSG